MGSLNQNETRKEHMLLDMPPLGLIQKNYVFLNKLWPMQKKITTSKKKVGRGYFLLELRNKGNRNNPLYQHIAKEKSGFLKSE